MMRGRRLWHRRGPLHPRENHRVLRLPFGRLRAMRTADGPDASGGGAQVGEVGRWSQPWERQGRVRRSAAGNSGLRKKYRFRLHVDAAYGGYFRLASNLDVMRRAPSNASRRRLDCDRSAQAWAATLRCGWCSFAIGDGAVVQLIRRARISPPGTAHSWWSAAVGGSCAVGSFAAELFAEGSLHLGKSALNARAQGRRRLRCGRRNGFASVRGGEFARGLERCREAALHSGA